MKKIFTSLKAMLVLAALSFSANSFATTYYAFYTRLIAAPEGKGLVYVTSDSEDVPTDDQFAAESEFEKTAIYCSAYFHAKPADGYQVAGYSLATFDEFNEPIFNDEIVVEPSADAYASLSSNISGDDEATVQASMPLDPNIVYYALFTRVVANVHPQMKKLGKTTISKVCNDLGDEVTLTATPNYDETCKFAYWVKASTGEKITTNPLTITVDGMETYTAEFTSDLRVDLDFGEEVSYKTWYNERGASIPEEIHGISLSISEYFFADSVEVETGTKDNLRHTYVKKSNFTYNLTGKQAAVIFGQGVQTLILDQEVAESEGTGAVKLAMADTKVSDLSVSHRYYTIDYVNSISKLFAKDAVIAEGTPYLAVPVEMLMEGELEPETIYWSMEASVGMPWGPDAIVNAVAPNAQNKSIYTLDGKKATSLKKNQIYVIDGKTMMIK